MIDHYDIGILKSWLKLAKTKGTDAIKIVAGPLPGTYTVTITIERRDRWYGTLLPR